MSINHKSVLQSTVILDAEIEIFLEEMELGMYSVYNSCCNFLNYWSQYQIFDLHTRFHCQGSLMKRDETRSIWLKTRI